MTNQAQLKILFWIANGIQNKTEKLQTLANKLNLDIIVIDETKINPKTNLKIRTDTDPPMGNRYHGGTAVLVHRRIVHSYIDLKANMSSTSKIINLAGDLNAKYKSSWQRSLQPFTKSRLLYSGSRNPYLSL